MTRHRMWFGSIGPFIYDDERTYVGNPSLAHAPIRIESVDSATAHANKVLLSDGNGLFTPGISSFALTAATNLSTTSGAVGQVVFVTTTRARGIFRWSATDPHGLGADNGVVFAADPSTGGYWVRETDGMVHTDYYNPTADGATDDTTKLQAAANMAGVIGTIMFLDEGIHSVSKITAKAGMLAIGGRGELKARSAAVTSVIEIGNGLVLTGDTIDVLYITDISINVNSINTQGITINDSNQIHIRGARIRGVPAGYDLIEFYHNCYDCSVIGCRLEGSSAVTEPHQAIATVGRTDSDWWSAQVRADTTDGYQFHILSTDNPSIAGSTLTITTGKFKSTDVGAKVWIIDAAVEYAATVATFVDSNNITLSGSFPTGVIDESWIQPGVSQFTETGPIVNLQIIGNSIYNVFYGVGLFRADHCIVADNVIWNCSRGVSCQTSSRWNSISDNVIIDAASTGIHLAFGARYNKIEGNVIRRPSGAFSGDSAGIQDYVNGEHNMILNNQIFSGGDAAGYRSGIYVGPGSISGLISGNKIINTRVCVNFESNWISGMDGANGNFTRSNSVNYVTANKNLANWHVVGNDLTASTNGTCFHFSQIDDFWGTVYNNSNHVLQGNRDLSNGAYLMWISEDGGVVENITCANFRSTVAKAIGNWSIPRARNHFAFISDCDGLTAIFDHIYSSGNTVVENVTGHLFFRNLSAGDRVWIERKDSGGTMRSYVRVDDTGVALFVSSPTVQQVVQTVEDGIDLVQADGKLKVAGTQVLTTQQVAVSNASGGATVDAEARTAINDLLARVRTHGIIAT